MKLEKDGTIKADKAEFDLVKYLKQLNKEDLVEIYNIVKKAVIEDAVNDFNPSKSNNLL